MKKHLSFIIILTGFLALSFHKSKFFDFNVPGNWPKPKYDFSKNRLTAEKVLLGRVLFYDPILSRDNSISCASCHSQYTAFAHVDHDLSHGIENRVGTRNAPALMNLAWHDSFMWDGAIHNLDVQALAPIHNRDEMDETIEHVVNKLQLTNMYPGLFFKAFGDSVITGEHTLKAISQFLLTLVSSDSKYDRVMLEKDTFTTQEKKGYILFKKNCESCHKEPLFTSGEFVSNGLPVDTTLNDFGRMKITKAASDSIKFKIPTLRNIEFSYPYMHDGRFKKLKDVLNHYVNGISKGKKTDYRLQKQIKLNSNEKVDLTAFLLTLTDKEFLFNQEYSYPRDILLIHSKE